IAVLDAGFYPLPRRNGVHVAGEVDDGGLLHIPLQGGHQIARPVSRGGRRTVLGHFQSEGRQLLLQQVADRPFIPRLAIRLHQLQKLFQQTIPVDQWLFPPVIWWISPQRAFVRRRSPEVKRGEPASAKGPGRNRRNSADRFRRCPSTDPWCGPAAQTAAFFPLPSTGTGPAGRGQTS